jgi:predicted transcriptional regulator
MEVQPKTRLLLALWDLGGVKQEVKKSELIERVKRSSEKAGDYKELVEKLEQAGAIKIATNKRVVNVLLTDQGLQVLGQGIKSEDFLFEGNQVGARVANALLKWIRQMDGAVVGTYASVNEVNGAIASGKAIESYDEFKSVTLEVYDKLNRNHKLNDLVQIYRIRREIGNRISPEHFDEWMLKMQENDIFQLMAGEMPDITPDKRDDSITIPKVGLRYYAKRLS